MKLEVLESSGRAARLLLKGATASYANAIRRVAMNYVSSFAIEKVTFYENTSAMFDEYIAHRLGLIPITTPDSGYEEKDEILLSFDATGPRTVYSKDLEGSDKGVKVANGDIPIIRLAPDQRVKAECKAVLGQGIRHAKFQPGLVTIDQKSDSDFEFYVESFGQMPPVEIINKSLDRVKEEMKAIEKEAKRL